MTSSSRDALPVPDEAWNALLLELAEHHGIHDQGCVRDIAAPVLAARERWLAARLESLFPDGHPWRDGVVFAATQLRYDADELDPQKTEARDG